MAVYNASLDGAGASSREGRPFLIAVLAGGEGRRMGGGKPHQALAGRPLIRHVIDRVQPDFLCGDPADLARYGLPVCPDPAPGLGPLAGVAAALAYALEQGRDSVLTVPCDTPFLPQDLAARFAGVDGPAMASSGGHEHPSVARWPVEWLDIVKERLSGSGSRALRPFFLAAPRIEWPVGAFDNINTPDDLAAAEARLRTIERG
ncbi:NTP transferase domain-containing protein [Lacibacterium aquatile]|uniref:Molybdenum cofactor guanylyltransferase n=1 Tax=Lacibacterium aquatile TaxID=1168082 RepID=A0ABW5DNR2_9PROT